MNLNIKSNYTGFLYKFLFTGYFFILIIPMLMAENPFVHTVVHEELGRVYQYQVLYSDINRKLHPLIEYHWHLNGKLRSTFGDYSGNLLHGEFEEFDKSNRLFSKGVFFYGVKDGDWKYWNRDGEICGWEKWRKGFLIQKTEINRTQKIIENFRKNELQGKRLIYQGNEKKLTERYRNGVLINKENKFSFGQFFKLNKREIEKKHSSESEVEKTTKKKKGKKENNTNTKDNSLP